MYDGAHVLGLIAVNNPRSSGDGMNLITASTHKTGSTRGNSWK